MSTSCQVTFSHNTALDEFLKKKDDVEQELTIEIPADHHITITDNFSVSYSSQLTFKVMRNASVMYRMRAFDRKERENMRNHERVIAFVMQEPGAHVAADMRLLFTGTERSSLSVIQHHVAPITQSSVAIRGVCAQKARFNVQNLIRIEQSAQQAKAKQEHKNLLLDAGARAFSEPSLEVIADDVSCSHGSAISPLSPEHLFYLQSRGLSLPEARQIIVNGFLGRCDTTV